MTREPKCSNNYKNKRLIYLKNIKNYINHFIKKDLKLLMELDNQLLNKYLN